MVRYNDIIDDHEIQRAIKTLKDPGELFEIRLISSNKKGPAYSGYFTDPAKMVEELHKLAVEGRNGIAEYNVYFVINEINPDCYAREQRDRFVLGAGTTSDGDITRRRYFFIDFDPERISGTSSTDAELNSAIVKAEKVSSFLREQGFAAPMMALSGNGVHIMYKTDAPNDEEAKTVFEGFYKALDAEFSDNEDAPVKVDIDCTIFNAARICKLYGSLAKKGANTQERPHRMSTITAIPEKWEPVPYETVKRLTAKLKAMQPQPENTRKGAPSKGTFDVYKFLSEHGVSYKDGGTWQDAKMLCLDECVFDSSHTHGDAKIFIFPDGVIRYKCHHNSCQGKQWHDVRLKLDPHAYDVAYKDDHRIENGYQKHKALTAAPVPIAPPEAAAAVDDFLHTILSRQYEAIPTGYTDIDRALGGGFFRQQVVMLSAAPGTGKTALAAQILEKMAEHGTDCIYYNLEMSREQLLARSLSRIGADNMTALEILQGYKQTPERQAEIRKTAELYRRTIAPHMMYHECGPALENILEDMTEAANKAKEQNLPAPIVCIDYLHILTSEEIKDPVEILKAAVTRFKNFAKEYNTAVLIINANNRTANKSGASSMESGRDTSAIEYCADAMLALSYAEADRPGKDRETAEEIRDKIKEAKDAGKATPDKYSYLSLRVTKSRFAEPNSRAVLMFDGAHAKMTQVDALDYNRLYGSRQTGEQLLHGFRRGKWPEEEDEE